MEAFTYRRGEMFAEDIAVARIAAQVGTPFYCYSSGALHEQYIGLRDAFGGRAHICYAVKANANLSVVRTFAALGAGADVVSLGEIKVALAAGIAPRKIVLSGVGKTRQEMAEALDAGIGQFTVESEAELVALDDVARGWGKVADVAIRINPDIDAESPTPKIKTGLRGDKFGILWPMARASYRAAAGLKALRVVGVSVHIGSQITSTEPFRKVLHFLKDVVRDLRSDGHRIERIDLGGGLGVRYIDEVPPTPKEYADVVLTETEGLGCEITIEPGRFLVANAGVLVTRVLYEKVAESATVDPVRIVIVDAGMNDLVRPAMYDSRHAIVPVKADGGRHTKADIVGPICESSDRFAQDWPLPPTVPNDLLVIRSAGAYGSSMASTYNSRPLVAEVMVQGREFAVVRPRQTYESLLAGEALPPWLVVTPGVG